MQLLIISMKREIAQIYYHKIDLLKRFFLEWMKTPTATHDQQMEYICESFPFYKWKSRHLIDGRSSGSFDATSYDSLVGYDIISSKNYCCLVHCDTLWQAEEQVLDPLRESGHAFFILEAEGRHYGWISRW
ncbi:sporulation inhibitor of replication protein SirA [Halobacillus fulvus]|nr:sporulation inhibitor of replication protein SirA [Halobacillus fulvus]